MMGLFKTPDKDDVREDRVKALTVEYTIYISKGKSYYERRNCEQYLCKWSHSTEAVLLSCILAVEPNYNNHTFEEGFQWLIQFYKSKFSATPV